MHIVYAPDIHADTYLLSKEESYHCIKVLRLRIDDKIQLMDGMGNFFSGIIIDNDPRECGIKIMETHKEPERAFKLHIAMAPTKNIDRFEWFLEKATEIGIDEITPIVCAHSERKIILLDRLEKISIAAIKQSVKATLPKINPMITFKELMKSSTETQKFITNCQENQENHLMKKYLKGNDCMIIIGPEGDFSPDELTMAMKNGFESVSLGKYRLRTETAGMVACDIINLKNID
ncbi:MAG: 16S rRNA (uracil(1498)-N(3))-methyltransferase [Bacteroidota bacterium]